MKIILLIILVINFWILSSYREQKDPHFLREKVTHKQAKELLEAANKIEQDFKSLFSGKSIPPPPPQKKKKHQKSCLSYNFDVSIDIQTICVVTSYWKIDCVN